MALTTEQIHKLMGLIGITQDEELDCNQCLDVVAEFAECQLTGVPIPTALRAVQHHLDICAECREEYLSLMRLLDTMEGSPPKQE